MALELPNKRRKIDKWQTFCNSMSYNELCLDELALLNYDELQKLEDDMDLCLNIAKTLYNYSTDVIKRLTKKILEFRKKGEESYKESDDEVSDEVSHTVEGFTCYVFICAYTPMKYQIKLSNAPDIMSTCDMKKHLRRKKLPAGVKSFQRLELKNESSPYVVYFALFHSKRYVSGGGFSLQNIFKEKEPDCWSLDKLPPHGPDCLSFFFTGDYLKLEKKKRELEQKKRELKQRKIQLLEWQVQTHTADGMTVEPDQTTLAGLTTLTNECNILEREIRSLKITKSPHPDEDSRTQELFQSLSDQKAFSGLHSSLHQRTYHEPPSFSSDICLHSGGCDILFYSDKAAAINVSIPVEVSNSKGECSGCSSTEHKLLPNTDHEEQLSAEGYVMASRLLYYRIVNGLRPDTVTCSSVYAALFEVAGSIIIRKYKLNFLTQHIERCDKLVLPMTEDNLSISIQQLINKTKKVTNKSFYCLY